MILRSTSLPPHGTRIRNGLLASGWLLAVLGAFAMVGWRSGQGVLPAGSPVWPAGSAIQRLPGEPTLLVFVHPRCPCTRASLANLERMLARLPRAIDVRMVVFRPADAEPGWEEGGIRARAAQVPRARLVTDVTGTEARLFGAPVSGTMLLYRADGSLAFAGGITPTRGHEGDCASLERLRDILSAEPLPPSSPESRAAAFRAPAYGCTVTDSDCVPQVDDSTPGALR